MLENLEQVVKSEFAAKNKQEGKPREVGKYYPSEVFNCKRKIFYNWYYYDEREEPLPLGLFSMGKAAEEALFKIVKEYYGDRIESQRGFKLDITDRVRIQGYTDFVLLDENGRVKKVWEIKSVGVLYDKKKEVSLPHRGQLTCYLKAMKCLDGAVVYIERGNIEKIKEFEVPFDFNFWERIVSYFKTLNMFIETNTLPPQQPEENWECNYCPFKKKCTEDGIC